MELLVVLGVEILIMKSQVKIETVMNESGVQFGTSGARGLVTQMTDAVCCAYTMGFLQYLHQREAITTETKVVVGGDLRPSTPRILNAIAFAARRLGHEVEFAGYVPSPAVALRGLTLGAPAIMITGSHIPDDRNGIKFNTANGEITKTDEAGVRAQSVTLPNVFSADGSFKAAPSSLPLVDKAAENEYLERYFAHFPAGCLTGSRIGVYGHSAVGREILVTLYERLGATVTRLGFSEKFIPVDTEAVRQEDCDLARGWAEESHFDLIVSTDGDSDRPLTFDERGDLIRGDVSGIVTARFLSADAVATPVSCNTALEKLGVFPRVLRSRIGSPFVIEKMNEAERAGAKRIVGYEANGGFLTLSPLPLPGGKFLPPLPTRDAVIVHLALLISARTEGVTVSGLLSRLPERFTASGRDQAFANERSRRLFADLSRRERTHLEETFALGTLRSIDTTDGWRYFFDSGEIVHLRASGNAPELRCYAEASTAARAAELVERGLAVARRLVPN